MDTKDETKMPQTKRAVEVARYHTGYLDHHVPERRTAHNARTPTAAAGLRARPAGRPLHSKLECGGNAIPETCSGLGIPARGESMGGTVSSRQDAAREKGGDHSGVEGAVETERNGKRSGAARTGKQRHHDREMQEGGDSLLANPS